MIASLTNYQDDQTIRDILLFVPLYVTFYPKKNNFIRSFVIVKNLDKNKMFLERFLSIFFK